MDSLYGDRDSPKRNERKGTHDANEKSRERVFGQVCCQRFRGAKAEAAAIAAKRRAEIGVLLQKAYSRDNYGHLGQLYELAKSAAAKGNEEIARLAEEFGMDLQFGPSLTIDYGDWPYSARQSCDEEMRMAEFRIGRLETEAAAQIERTSMDTVIQLMGDHLTPAEAKVLVEAIPPAVELIPEWKGEDPKQERDHPGKADEAHGEGEIL